MSKLIRLIYNIKLEILPMAGFLLQELLREYIKTILLYKLLQLQLPKTCRILILLYLHRATTKQQFIYVGYRRTLEMDLDQVSQLIIYLSVLLLLLQLLTLVVLPETIHCAKVMS